MSLWDSLMFGRVLSRVLMLVLVQACANYGEECSKVGLWAEILGTICFCVLAFWELTARTGRRTFLWAGLAPVAAS